MMMKQVLSKDELRVKRSIHSIMSKINASLERTAPRSIQKERDFEQSCIEKGLIYSPNKIYF